MASAPPVAAAPRAPAAARAPVAEPPPATDEPPTTQPWGAKRLHRASLTLTAALAKDPWMRELSMGSAADAKAALHARWRDVPSWLRPLRARVLGGRIEGFAGDAERAFVEIRARDRVQLLYVASPTPAADVERALAALGLDATSPLFALALHFDRLWELSPLGVASRFVGVTEWTTVAAARKRQGSVFAHVDRDDLQGWFDAIIVRKDENDMWLVVSPSTGAVAHISTELVERRAPSLERYLGR
jgi:hypothetical protein